MLTDLAEVKVRELRFNYEELKAALQESLEQYKTQIVTPDTISDARADRAKLNKLKDGINSYRIGVKKQLMEQYDTDFKPKCDELVSMVDEAASNIGGQIRAFEQAEANAKIDRIKQYYNDVDGSDADELRQYCPFEAIYSEKWRNKGTAEDSIKEAVTAALDKTCADLAVIRTMDEQDVPYLLDVYKQTRDLGAVMRRSTEIKIRREKEQQRRAREDAEKKRREALQRPASPPAETVDVPVQSGPAVPSRTEADGRAVRPIDLRVWVDRDQMLALKEFMIGMGIRFEPVPR